MYVEIDEIRIGDHMTDFCIFFLSSLFFLLMDIFQTFSSIEAK
jgi:hypothetical protein